MNLRQGLALSALLLLGIQPVVAQTFNMSEQDTRYFQFFRAEDQMYIRPGNDGLTLLANPQRAPDSGLSPWQDDYCDSRMLELDSPEYAVRLNDSGTSRPYWNHLDQYAGQMTMSGYQAFWVINDSFVELTRRWPECLTELLAHLQSYRKRYWFIPAVVFKVSHIDEDVMRMYEKLIAAGFVAGVHLTAANPVSKGDCRWGFVIVDEELLPAAHSGATTARWGHSKFGQVPVMISPQSPNFLRDTIWLTNDIAGLAFRPLNADSATSDAGNLRADTAFLNRFSGVMAMKPRASVAGVTLELESKNRLAPDAAWILQPDARDVSITLPDPGGAPGQAAGWYRPESDENILRPIAAPLATLVITPPNSGQWIYTTMGTRLSPDQNTTVTAIRDWED